MTIEFFSRILDASDDFTHLSIRGDFMTHPGKNQKDDILVFANESDTHSLGNNQKVPQKFKLLIVDDEKEIHVMTKLVLSDYGFQNATLEFLSAYSAKEAKTLIKKHPDAACILLDVVMEEKDAGLEVARYIREDLKNDKIRIILRTGQPGKAPENDVILNYDINDYKEKTELTTQKLFTTITTALRSYIHLVDLEKKKILIEEKNTQLNDEVARRIVAESNLTKYNRSLEKMIDDKSSRLKTAIKALRQKENELKKANQLAQIGDISSATLDSLNVSSDHLKDNLEIMSHYQSDMTILLEKYETLQSLINANAGLSVSPAGKTKTAIDEIDQLRKEVKIELILERYPEIIKDSAQGISQISKAVDDIKRFVSITEENLVKRDLNQLLQKVLNQIQKSFVSSIEVQSRFDTIPIFAMATQNMEKAFSEIFKNAFQSIESKGIISVSTLFHDPNIEIHVSDVGCGIEAKYLDTIFNPYVSIGKKGAKGLGLSFARSVITSHGGSIGLTSRVNEGTHLTVKIPVSSPGETSV